MAPLSDRICRVRGILHASSIGMLAVPDDGRRDLDKTGGLALACH